MSLWQRYALRIAGVAAIAGSVAAESACLGQGLQQPETMRTQTGPTIVPPAPVVEGDPFLDDPQQDPTSILDDLPPFQDPTAPQGPEPILEELTEQEAQPPLQATPTAETQTPNFDTSGFRASLARAPYMLGDFFGPAGTTAVVPQLVGQAVRQINTNVSGGGRHSVFQLVGRSDSEVVLLNKEDPRNLWLPSTVLVGPDSSTESSQVEGLRTLLPRSSEYLAVKTNENADLDGATGSLGTDFSTNGDIFDIYEINRFILPNPSAGIVGRVRLQDNNSALPQDRFFFDYNYFHNVPMTADGVNVNRFTPGFERTVWGGASSIEVRVPMASTLDSNFVTFAPETSNWEFGNIAVAQKFLIAANQNMALASGIGIAAPTGDDLDVRIDASTPLILVKNEAFHLLPYIAILVAPQYEDWFAHGFVTFDYDLNGSAVLANTSNSGLREIGTFRDQHLVTFSGSFGKWLYRNECCRQRVNGLMVTGELHYTQSLDDLDAVRGGNFVVGTPGADLSILNGTIGAHVQMGNTLLTAGYTTPLSGDDRVFDGEFRVFVNRKY